MSYSNYSNDEKEKSTFEKKIEQDSNICNNCYRKLREHTESMHDTATAITEYENHADFGYFDDFNYSGRPNVKKAYCKCGAVDWNDVRVRPLDKEQMLEIGERLVKHLIEKGYEVDSQKMISYIDAEADLPDNQFKEEEVLEEAVSEFATKREE